MLTPMVCGDWSTITLVGLIWAFRSHCVAAAVGHENSEFNVIYNQLALLTPSSMRSVSAKP